MFYSKQQLCFVIIVSYMFLVFLSYISIFFEQKKHLRKMMKKRFLEKNVDRIPIAPIYRRVIQASDYDYMERKHRLADRLPYFTKDEIARRKHPYYVVLLSEMWEAGYKSAVKELAQLFQQADKIIDKTGVSDLVLLVSTPQKVYRIAEILGATEECETDGLIESDATIRMEFAEELLKEKDIWLAKHFLRSALAVLAKPEIKTWNMDSLQSQIHCLLAFIAREYPVDFESALESAVSHLAICRDLSQNQTWYFRPNVLSIRLKKPISLHGLRNEYTTVDASSMSLYMVATLLEHEMMLGLADHILHSHRFPSDADIAQAHIFADNALRLAFEVHHPVALSSALLRFGIVLRHAGEYDDAIKYFKQLWSHSEVSGDNETVAIAQHNIAMTHMSKHEPLEALEWLTRQKEIADTFEILDLQADALEELGSILLQEGQLWESEECYALAYNGFKSIESEKSTATYHEHCDRNFAMWGISAGHQLWSRFASLARSDTYESLVGLVEWKSRRTRLPKVPRPNYKVQKITDIYTPYHIEPYEEEEVISATPSVESESETTEAKRASRLSSYSATDLYYYRNLIPASSSVNEFPEIRAEEYEYASDMNHIPEEVESLRLIMKERKNRMRLEKNKNAI